MSGGVDSSVAAALLKKEGYEVIGIMLRIWSEKQVINKCCSSEAMNDARKIAGMINIPFYILDYQMIFKEIVVNYFLEESLNGFTPNPCFFCNQKVRFSHLRKEALRLGADFLATGHYARIKKEKDGYQLLKAKDKKKDQSYMLHRLNQEQLATSIFPLGELCKEEVRKIAEKWGFSISKKKDSQDLCFLDKDGTKGFFKRQLKDKIKKGKVINSQGEVLGEHQGLMAYTIGQRKGLGISAQKPLFVIGKDQTKNNLIVGFTDERKKQSCYLEKLHFVSGEVPQTPLKVSTKIRYQAQENSAKLFNEGINSMRLEFEQEVEDISPGQGAVFYNGEQVIGGGIIG